MNIRIKFLGGAGSVTGSKFFLEIDKYKILIDCGLFQGIKELRLRNRSNLPINSEEIDAVILTHAHLDHSGYLPKLVKEGFRGSIHATTATKDLLELLLRDSAKLQEEEALYAFKKGYSKHNVPEPLYTQLDSERVFPLIKTHLYKQDFQLAPNIIVTFHNAGHILGSAIIELKISADKQTKTIVISGDLGPKNHPILNAPDQIKKADIVLVESTYGDKDIQKNHKTDLAFHVNNAFSRKGCLLIPSFSIGRTQDLIYYLYELRKEGKIPQIEVFIDSPMAINATEIYQANNTFNRNQNFNKIFNDPMFNYCTSRVMSQNLNSKSKGTIIISASGMCTGGRILHHLYHRLPKSENTVLFIGYQAKETRGDKLLRGEPTIKIFGQEVPVQCNVEKIDGFSAHADQSEIINWLKGFENKPKVCFVVHGENESSKILARKIKTELKWNTIVPNYLENIELFKGI